MLYEEFQSLEQVQEYAFKCKHNLIIKEGKFILTHTGNANKLTYNYLSDVVNYLQKLEASWTKAIK